MQGLKCNGSVHGLNSMRPIALYGDFEILICGYPAMARLHNLQLITQTTDSIKLKNKRLKAIDKSKHKQSACLCNFDILFTIRPGCNVTHTPLQLALQFGAQHA